MASTNKTPKLGLNQWEPGDSVLREDFNGDNAKLEAGINLSMDYMRVERYVGDGIADRFFHLGFKPRFLILTGMIGASYPMTFFCTNIVNSGISATNVYLFSDNGQYHELTADGFLLKHGSGLNELNMVGCYIAFR